LPLSIYYQFMKIALAHDYLNQFGGAERVLKVLCELFPDAPIYTLFYDRDAIGDIFAGHEIRTSFLQKVPGVKKYHRFFPLLMPLAIEQFDFSDFDIVLSVAASFAKGIITKPTTCHVCYCLTPPRFLWDSSQKFVEDFGYPGFIKKLLPPSVSYLRVWDREASLRVDEFVAISDFVKDRVKKYYLQNAEVIYPPVDISQFNVSHNHNGYFLMVGRLVAYKKFDLAIRAFNKLGLPLKIAGTGVEMNSLKKMAGFNIEFLDCVGDEKLAELYSGARALIFPQEEDFGIVPLEAMASGKPVIAYRGGGALETVADGQTGIFFDQQGPDFLIEAIRRFENMHFGPKLCRAQAEKFSTEIFKKNILNFLDSKF